MRTTSEAFRRAANAPETGEVLICLLTVSHNSMEEPIRLSSDPTVRLSSDPLSYGTESRGNQYLFLPFEFVLPQDTDDSPPRVEIVFSNVDSALVGILRAINEPLDILVEVVMASSADFVETSLPKMRLANISYSAVQISATLVVDGLVTEPFPSANFNPGRFPALF